ncbi:MAG: chalcone isomerase family protein, partial [Gammaproteobacteria bacterium]
MKSIRLSAVLLAAGVFCLSAPLASVAETVVFADAEFSKTTRVGDHELQLANLARLYYKVIFTGAAVGLYLNKETAPDALLNDVPKRLEFVYFGSLDAEDFVAAANESLADNLDSKQLEQLRDDIDAFNDLYVDIKKYDRYAISYAPDYGLELALN